MSREATLTVVSDPICPWCYIGKARLGVALKEIEPEISLRVEWNPFELNPFLPKKGIDRADYLRIKFGSTSSAKKIYRQILINAKADELELNLEAIKKVPNTRDAHKLISANSPKLQNLIVSKLFEAYFILGVDIGEADNLTGYRSKVGISAIRSRKHSC